MCSNDSETNIIVVQQYNESEAATHCSEDEGGGSLISATAIN